MIEKLAAFCLILFLVLAGVGQIALMPPFEGHDEFGHYSSMRQVAKNWREPLSGSSFLDRIFVDYRAEGPMPYASASSYEANEGLTYPEFFARGDLVQAYAARYRTPGANPSYAPSEEPNWQAQHPPLYYLLMAPVVKATGHMSFWAQLFVLRLFSYLLALAGWGLGLWGTLLFMKRRLQRFPILYFGARESEAFPCVMACCGPTAQRRVLAAFLLFPLFMPQFFPEFARLGNDSLCLFLMGGVWACLLGWLDKEGDSKRTLVLGTLLAAGLLTKALFLPVAAGLGGFLLFRLWRAREDGTLFFARFDAAVLLFLPSLFALFWYVYKWKATGSLIGHPEYALLAAKGGIFANWPKEAGLKDLLLGFYALPVTFSWAGTASLARPIHFFQLPLVLFPFALIGRYLWGLKGHAPSGPFWLPVWFVLPFLAGLIHHQLAMIALETTGGTPAWYLHVLLPPLAFAFSYGMAGLIEKRNGQKFFLFIMAYVLLFLCFVFWAQMPLFAGFAGESGEKIFSFSTFPFDLPLFYPVMDRLELLSWPWLGLACQMTGLLFLGAGVVFFGLSFKEKRPRG